MAKNKKQVVVALDGAVHVAPAGTAYPVDLDPVAEPFVDLGYYNQDGVTFSVTPEILDINAAQSANPIRRIVQSRALSLSFNAQQWNVHTFASAFGGGEWTEADGIYRYDPPADEDDLTDYVVVLDLVDGDKQYRLVVKECNVTEAAETSFNRSGEALLPITFSASTPDGDDRSWYLLSNDPAVAPETP